MNTLIQINPCPLGNSDPQEGCATPAASGYLCSYCDLVQNVNSIILVLTPEGEIKFANQFACKFFGYALEELLGKSVFATLVPSHDRSGEVLAARLAQKHRDQDERFASNINENVLRDGTRVWIAWRNQAIRDADGKVIEVLTVGNDITEPKRVSDEICHSEGALCQTMDAAMQPVLVTRLRSGEIVSANARFESIFGYSREEVKTLSLEDLILETPECTFEQVRRALDQIDAEKSGSQPYSVLECLCKRKDGQTYWAEITLSYLDRDPEPQNLCVIYDISSRKRSEERLLQQRNRLADLLQAQERERKLIAYEIHDGPAQHLAAATMQLEVCQQMLDKDRAIVERTLTEARAMLRQTLFEVRHLIADLRPPQLDDSGVIAAIETLVEESPSTPEVRFEHDVDFKRLEPLAENSIFRIVQESLTNASRYSQSEMVLIRLVQTDGKILLEIQDEGIGFQPSKIEKDRFGLSGIHERANVLGGHAVIRSSPGLGTCVTIELPSTLVVE